MFGDFRLDRADRSLSRNGRRVALRPKSYALLDHLVLKAGRLVTKEELLDGVWPDVAVSETVLKVCVRELREALGDDPRRPTFIETRHRVGYTFVATVRAAGRPVEATPTPTSFVGRSRELAVLRRMLHAAAAGEAGTRLVFVSGEAGLGKSALVDAFLREATSDRPDLSWCGGTCVEQHGQIEPLFVFLEGLGTLAAAEGELRERLRTLAPSWCLRLPELFALDDGLAADALGATRPRMLRELRAMLGAMPGSLVWVLEDLQWADPSSVDLLRYLASACRRERVLFVVTLRPSATPGPVEECVLELLARGQCERLALQPLSREEVWTYLDVVLGPEGGDPAWREWMAARTEGHPLFLTSLVQHLVATGGLARDDDGQLRPRARPEELSRSVPASVGAMVERKLGALDPEGRRALAAAAVQGIEVLSDVLARTLGQSPEATEEQLDRLCRVQHLLLPPTEPPTARPALQYRFVHALYRDALYASLTPTRRAALHREIGLALEERSEPGEREALAPILANHFDLGGEPERALVHLGVVVETAERRLALSEAEAACAQALARVERLPADRQAPFATRFHKRRAGLRIAAGRFDGATDDLTAMRARAHAAGDVQAEIDALLLTFRQLGYLGRFAEASAVADEAGALADAHGLSRSEIDGNVATLRGVRGELAAACEVLASATGTHVALAFDYGAFLAMRGRYAEAAPVIDGALGRARSQSDALRVGAGLFWRAHAQANRGLVSAALQTLDEAIRLSERNDDAFVLPRQLALAGWLRRELGAFEEAMRWDERALAADQGLMPDGHAHALLGVALSHVALGDADAADGRLREVEATLVRPFFGDWLVRTRLAGARARLELLRGRLDAAAAEVASLAALAAAHDLGKHRARAQLLGAEIALRRGDPADLAVETSSALIGWRVHALRVNGGAPAEEALAAVERLLAGMPPAFRPTFAAMAREAGLPSETPR